MTEIQIAQAKGQMEATFTKVEPYLEQNEFEDYCDNMQTCLAYLEKVKSRIKRKNQDAEKNETK